MKSAEMTLSAIRLRGNEALFKALGPVGFVRYMQQFVARGDYAIERRHWIDKIDLSDLAARGRKAGGNRKASD